MSGTTMSGTTCTPSFNQDQAYESAPRRRSSQIAPDEIVPDHKAPSEASNYIPFADRPTSSWCPPPQRSFDRLRRSISGLQDLIVVMSECSADSILSRLRPRSKRASEVPVEDLSGATQPKKRRDMIAEKVAARKKEKAEKKELEIRAQRKKFEFEVLDEHAVQWMKGWKWPDADSSSTVDDCSMEHEGEWFSEHGSD